MLVEASVGRFADGEVQVELGESVRGCDVYLVQPTCAPVNDNIMELLLLVRCVRVVDAGGHCGSDLSVWCGSQHPPSQLCEAYHCRHSLLRLQA